MCFTCRKWSNMYVIDSECRSSEAEDFESFVPFWSTLVPRIANIRDWSRHRFRQRSWSVFMRWNWSDFHQFSWSPGFCDIIFIDELNLFTPKADFLFLTLKSWFFSCMQPANITHIHFHSLWQAPTPQTFKIKKKPILWFSLVKNFIYDFWLVRYSFLKCEKPSNISEFMQFITNHNSLEYILVYMCILWEEKANKLQVHPYKPVLWLPTFKSPDEWATTKQACRDELVV